MAPFDTSHSSSYSFSIATMALSCIVSEIKGDIGRESRFFTYPVLRNNPPLTLGTEA